MDPEDHDLLLPLVTEENICLPLSINVVAKYWNVDIPLNEAQEAAKRYPEASGTVLIEGIELAEKHGLESKIIHSDVSELKKFIDMGIAPIVILPGVHDTIQHASVISGYDPDGKTIMHYVPKVEQDGAFHVGVIPEQKFDKNWSEDGRLAVIMAPSDVAGRIKSHPEERPNRLCFESEKYSLTRDPANSIKLLEEALSLDPDNVTAHSLLASVLNDQNSSACIEHYEECIKLNKNCYLAYRGLGNYFLKTKQQERAERYYDEAIGINPERYGPIYKNRGIVRLEQHNNAGAKSDLEKYLKYTPDAKDSASIRQAIKEL